MGIEYIQEVLGHRTISTAQIYMKIFQKNLRCEWILTSASERINYREDQLPTLAFDTVVQYDRI